VANFTVNAYFAAVIFDSLVTDREPQTHPVSSFPGSEERLKYMQQTMFGNSTAGVTEGNIYPFFCMPASHRDLALSADGMMCVDQLTYQPWPFFILHNLLLGGFELVYDCFKCFYLPLAMLFKNLGMLFHYFS